MKGTHTREPLTKCTDLRCDSAIRKVAIAKQDSRLLALASRDLVAARAHYHRSCYRNHTRDINDGNESFIKDHERNEGPDYNDVESSSYEKPFDFVRQDLLEMPRVKRLTELTKMLITWMSIGIMFKSD